MSHLFVTLHVDDAHVDKWSAARTFCARRIRGGCTHRTHSLTHCTALHSLTHCIRCTALRSLNCTHSLHGTALTHCIALTVAHTFRARQMGVGCTSTREQLHCEQRQPSATLLMQRAREQNLKAAQQMEMSDTEIEHQHRLENDIETQTGDYLGACKRPRSSNDGECTSDSAGMCSVC